MLELMTVKPSTGGFTGTEGVIQSYADLKDMMSKNSKATLSSGKNFQSLSEGYVTILLSDEAPVVKNSAGSPWGGYMAAYTSAKIAAQHSAPTLDIWKMLWKDLTQVMVRIGPSVSSKTYPSVSRNGVSTSSVNNSSSQGYTPGWYIGDFIYWNSITRRVERMSPKDKETVPRLYDGKLL